MNIAVLGTGMVGRAVAARLHELGHTVVVGTRDPGATLARTEPDQMGNPPYTVWQEAHRGIDLATFAGAAHLAYGTGYGKARPRVQVAPAVGPTFAGVALGGRF